MAEQSYRHSESFLTFCNLCPWQGRVTPSSNMHCTSPNTKSLTVQGWCKTVLNKTRAVRCFSSRHFSATHLTKSWSPGFSFRSLFAQMPFMFFTPPIRGKNIYLRYLQIPILYTSDSLGISGICFCCHKYPYTVQLSCKLHCGEDFYWRSCLASNRAGNLTQLPSIPVLCLTHQATFSLMSQNDTLTLCT